MSFLENEGWPSQAGYTAIAERPAAGPQPSVPHCLSLPPPLLLPLPTLSTFALVLSPLAASPAHYCPLRRRCRRHPMPPPIRQALHAGDCGHDCAHVDGAEPATCSVRFGVCNGEGAIVVLVVRFVEDRIHCVGWGPSARSEGCVSMCGHSSPVQSSPFHVAGHVAGHVTVHVLFGSLWVADMPPVGSIIAHPLAFLR